MPSAISSILVSMIVSMFLVGLSFRLPVMVAAGIDPRVAPERMPGSELRRRPELQRPPTASPRRLVRKLASLAGAVEESVLRAIRFCGRSSTAATSGIGRRIREIGSGHRKNYAFS